MVQCRKKNVFENRLYGRGKIAGAIVDSVIRLSGTAEEIDETSLSHLKPFVGREYELTFDDTTRSTRIKKGYFWNHETPT